MGAATLWRDLQAVTPGRAPDPEAALHDPQAPRKPWVEVDETQLSIDGEKRPVAVVPGPKGERLACARLVPASTGATGSWTRGTVNIRLGQLSPARQIAYTAGSAPVLSTHNITGLSAKVDFVTTDGVFRR